MKKIYSFLFVIFFGLVGCTAGNKEPVISINGSDESVVVNEEYTDKGATAVNPSGENLSVIVDNKVDTSKVGSYQVVYTVNYDGKVYNAIRNVSVIEPTLNDKEINLLKGALAIKKNMLNPETAVFVNAMKAMKYDDSGWGVRLTGKSAGDITMEMVTFILMRGDEFFEAMKSNTNLNIYDSEYDLVFQRSLTNKYLVIDNDPNVNIKYINYYLKLGRLPK